ncbi:MAG: thiamine pyrophosphate-dependent dehydrogenase E1 component subunit alpha [Chloroflexi bacterium]|nr:thiamine pyrophosphate-dependent dehydrogenase E1 component subunit alpha [Chloroflexota bacterium]
MSARTNLEAQGTGAERSDVTVSPGLLRWVLERVLLSRALDDRLWMLTRQGGVNFVLTARGHEVAQIASAAALRPGHDVVLPYYRSMPLTLALGVTPYEVLLGALARGSDPHSGGRQLTMHLSSPRLRILSMSSVVGSHIPHAAGAGWAIKMQGGDEVVACYFGDGATAEGDFHEGLNMAAIHRFPVIFFCENNGWAISVPNTLQMPTHTVAERAAAYNMPGIRVDGSDARAVEQAMRQAVQRARAGEGPTLIEAVVTRMAAHSSQDDDLYRTEAQRAEAIARDPLPVLKQQLIQAGQLTEAEIAEMEAHFRASILADADRAMAEPPPDPSRARRWLFAGDPPHPGTHATGGEAR